MGVVKDIWQGVKILMQFSWLGSKFVVKNTPATLGMLWEVKKEISNAVAQSLHDAHVEHKKNLLDLKIELMKKPPNKPLEDAIIVQETLLKAFDFRKGGKYDL